MRNITLGLASLLTAALGASCASHGTSASWPADLPRATPGTPTTERPPRAVTRALAEVSGARATEDIAAMVAFGTRQSASETESATRGIGAARRWVADQFRACATDARPLDISFIGYTQAPDNRRITRPTEIINVVATLTGSLPPSQRQEIWVLAHLDSRASDAADSTTDAPGANDDASGVAVLLEIARALGDVPLDHTVILAATSGEEQGLLGAWELARSANARGARIRAVLNNDMVGDPIGPYAPGSSTARAAAKVVRVFSYGVQGNTAPDDLARISALSAESDSPARQVARYIADVAALHDLPVRPALVFRNDRFLRGGDHTAFLREGILPSVRLTVPYEDYDRQHQDVRIEIDATTHAERIFGDTLEWIDPAYLAGAAELNLAAVMHLANAPTAPADVRIITAELDNETTLRWTPAPEADVAGYEIVTRPTTSPVWTRVIDVGDVDHATVPLSKDNLFFGVRAVDREGYRSLVSFAGSATE